MVEATMQPAPAEALIRELYRLRLRVRSRDLSEESLDLAIAVFAEDLGRHPADCALWALREWARRSKFWPAACELEELAVSAAAPRRAILSAIDRYDDPTWPRWMAELWGARPDGPRRRAESLARENR